MNLIAIIIFNRYSMKEVFCLLLIGTWIVVFGFVRFYLIKQINLFK